MATPQQKDLLESLVKEQVAKALLDAAAAKESAEDGGGGKQDPLSSLLSGIDAAKIAELISNQQKDGALAGPSSEPLASASTSSITYDKHGRRLYLPPPDAPSYDPTPIEELKSKGYPAPAPKVPAPKNNYVPGGLAKLASLKPGSLKKRGNQISKSSFDPKTKPFKAVTQKDVLGDIGDLSESDEGEENPNVLGSILVQGMKSGVFGEDVNEVEQELIKAKMKKAIKKEIKEEPIDDAPSASISCDQVSSSSEQVSVKVEVKSEPADEEPEEEPVESERARILRLEQEEAKRVLEEKDRALEKIEEKRKMLEVYYKNRQLSIDSMCSSPKGRGSTETEITPSSSSKAATQQPNKVLEKPKAKRVENVAVKEEIDDDLIIESNEVASAKKEDVSTIVISSESGGNSEAMSEDGRGSVSSTDSEYGEDTDDYSSTDSDEDSSSDVSTSRRRKSRKHRKKHRRHHRSSEKKSRRKRSRSRSRSKRKRHRSERKSRKKKHRRRRSSSESWDSESSGGSSSEDEEEDGGSSPGHRRKKRKKERRRKRHKSSTSSSRRSKSSRKRARDEQRKEADLARKKIKVEKEDGQNIPMSNVKVKEEKQDPLPVAKIRPNIEIISASATKMDTTLSKVQGLSAADIILGPRKAPEPKKDEDLSGTVKIKEEKPDTSTKPKEKDAKLPKSPSKTTYKSESSKPIKKPAPKPREEASDIEEDEDEDLPDNVRSFLDEMNELDKINKIRVKSKTKKPLEQKKVKREEPHKSKKSHSSKSSHKPSSSLNDGTHRDKQSSSESGSRKSKSSSSSHHSSKRRRDSKDEKEKIPGVEKEKIPGVAKKHADSTRHKSSSVSYKTEQRKSRSEDVGMAAASSMSPKKRVSMEEEGVKAIDIKTEEPIKIQQKRPDSTSPVPDFTAELDLLPDDFGDHFLPDALENQDAAAEEHVEANDDDGESIFDEEEDDEDELKRIFDEYQPDTSKAEEAAMRKAKRLEEAKGASGSSDQATKAALLLAASK